MRSLTATRAYSSRSADRNLRHQEADVFRRATAALRVAQRGDELDRARAVADNRLLWITVMSLLKDPGNELPDGLKASIISIGKTVERELTAEEPDLPFLIGINEQMVAGLHGL